MGILGKFFGGGIAPVPQWDEQTKLIHWKGERGSSDWTIGDSFEGVQVFGDTGSGKSSASAKLLATALLRAGYGGLVLTVKPEDAADWKKLLAENGRADDGIFFSPDSGHCFNFLQYEFDYGKSKPGLESLSAAQILSELVSLAQRGAGRADDFWSQSANEMISSTLEIIRAAGETPSLRLAKELIESAPRSLDDVKDSLWHGRSRLWALLQRGKAAAGVRDDFRLAENYWLVQFPQLPEKTRASVVATFTAFVAQYFCPEMVHRMFGRKTNLSPDDIAAGKVIVVNLPVKQFGAAGRFAGIVWKYCAQLAFERRTERERPVFIFVDEAHHFMTDYDQLFQTTARSSRCAVVYLTQSLSNYYALSPGSTGKHRVDSLCNCLKTKILHQCSHPETRQNFADAIGKRYDEKVSETVSHGKGAPQVSETTTHGYEFLIHPDRATRLKTGGKVNDCQVEGIIYKAGKKMGDKPYLLVADFDQRNLEPSSGHSAVTLSPPQP
jgi:hypothetical protein